MKTDKKDKIHFYPNNLDFRITASENLKLKKDEVIICFGFMHGNKFKNPNKPAWKTARFSTTDIDGKNFTELIVKKLIRFMFSSTARLHGWFK